MSRSNYTDDLDSDILNLYRGTVKRALNGKRGRAFLQELAAAMDAMEEKILIHGDLINENGCCAIGVVCKARNVNTAGVDVEDASAVGNLVNISKSMAAEIEYINDEDGPYNETPSERWVRVRKWVAKQLGESL